jgi:hypothetical protein
MKLGLSIFTLTTLAGTAFAQFTNFNTQKNWSMNKKELCFGGGATQFLGDLGGGKGIGKDYSLADMNLLRTTSFNITLAYRYRFHPTFATSSSLNVGRYQASDKIDGVHPGRFQRQIDIKSTLITAYQRIEYIVYANEKVGKRNSLPGLKGMKDKNTQFYIYTGLGLAYYNPQGGNKSKYPGVALRPLSTEGQGYAGGAKPYKLITAIVPTGLGYRMSMGRMWRVAFEATYFKTFTDYMDDVSTTYYNPKANGGSAGAEAMYFSNPAESGDWVMFKNGEKRGDNERDAFFYFNVTFSKNITYKAYQRGKPIRWKGVRAKF